MRGFGGTAWNQLAAAALLFAWAVVAVSANAAPPTGPVPLQMIEGATRQLPGAEPQSVSLPDTVTRSVAGNGPVIQPTYTLRAEVGTVGDSMAIYLPGVLAPARVKINGHTLSDNMGGLGPRTPRGADRLLLADVPGEFLRPGVNEIEITLAGLRRTSLSKVWIGSKNELRRMHDRKILLMVEGPIVAAAVIIALSLCVLVLWVRQNREPLYGYFGFGGLLWALHTLWTILPDPLLPPPHLGIWWTLGYAVFCAPLIVFCLRLSKWRLPRFERALWISIALGPALLYGGYLGGPEAAVAASEYWRLAWIGAVAVGVFAVGRYAWEQRNTQAMLLLGVGAIAFGFGLRDWLLDRDPSDNNPVFLTSYSGLLFFPLVAWILIDNFVQTARALSRLNVELEARVVDKSAELQRALDEMRLARDAAEAADRAKSNFLAVASHDLRQPAHALGLYVAALRSEQLTAEQNELTERMGASVTALDTMFNALLDISKMDAGAVVVELCPFDVESMLHRVSGDFSAEAADTRLRFSVRVSKAARGLRARSDPILVERIVRNLLGNAIRYTQTGGVLLACRLRGGHWRIEVRDTGPGIRSVDHDRIFEAFFQIDRHEQVQAGGLGLGLSIVRRLSQLLGHPLELKSVVNRGSCFALTLPVTAEAAESPQRLAQAGSLQGLGVGIIDDDPEVRASMSLLLGRWGCNVLAAETAEELIQLAGTRLREKVQVLVVDFQLRGGRSGVDAIVTVTNACGVALPSLIVSGASAPERLAQLQASGFEWLIKPVAAARLRTWLFQASRARVRLSPKGNALPSSADRLLQPELKWTS
jgi:signal transduction histidine kinase/FixJ family two-component response regulator